MTAGSYGPEGGTATAGTQERQQSSESGQERVQEKARQVTGQVQERAQDVKQQAGGRVREEVDRRSTEAGEQMRTTAEAIRRSSEELRTQGNDRQAGIVEQAAVQIDRLADYLSEANADRILSDVEDFGRRRPWAIAGAGALVGFGVSRLLKASSARRYEERVAGRSLTAPARPGMEPIGGQAERKDEPEAPPVVTTPAGPAAPEAF